MNASTQTGLNVLISRRELLRKLGILCAGATAGCTPARIMLHAHPEVLDTEPGKTDRVLLAFVDTVAPAAAAAGPDAIGVFSETKYPFAPYRIFFAGDLCRRSKARFGMESFERLHPRDRERIVEDGLHADSITQRLYQAAIFIAQLSVYGGICNDEGATPAIRFDGANDGFAREDISYPNPEAWLPMPATLCGNPA